MVIIFKGHALVLMSRVTCSAVPPSQGEHGGSVERSGGSSRVYKDKGREGAGGQHTPSQYEVKTTDNRPQIFQWKTAFDTKNIYSL